MSLRLLHTSDVHLGATFKVLGSRGRQQSLQIQETFRRVIDLAIEERVDAVLIAGDLFDSVRAARVQGAFVAEQFHRLQEAGIPVCAVAGNHDPLGQGGASLWRDLAARCPGLAVFGPGLEARTFAERGLTVVGRSVSGDLSPDSPLAGLPVARRTRYLVALAHGSVQRPDLPAQFGLITAAAIGSSGVDYLALGDWHSPRDVSSGGVTAHYSGSPEMIDVDQWNAGHVCLVAIDAPGDVTVTLRRTGRRRAARLALDLATAGGPEAVARAIRAQADPDTALVVILSGLAVLGDRVNVEQLHEDLAPEFFRLEIRDDSHLRPDGIDPSRYPENTVIGRFVRQMSDHIGAADGDARVIAEDALSYGVALLEGREILR